MISGSVVSTCAQGSGGSSLPSMPMQCPAPPRTCWVRSHPQGVACHPACIAPSACSRPLMTPPSPPGSKRSPCWVERFDVQFLGSVEVPCHQGNGILCAAMQKVSLESAVHLNPVGWPSRPLATEGSDGALGASGSRGPGSDSEACADRPRTELGWSLPPSHPQSNWACSALSALVPALQVYWV